MYLLRTNFYLFFVTTIWKICFFGRVVLKMYFKLFKKKPFEKEPLKIRKEIRSTRDFI